MSVSAIPPLSKDDFGDLYIDNIPLAARGLLPHNDYIQFQGSTNQEGTLPALWERVRCLFTLRRITFTSEDHTPRLVRSLEAHPLMIFFDVDRLIEAKTRQETGGLKIWLAQEAFSALQILSLSQGGMFMTQLNEVLERLAALAWQGRLRGDSLERSSLLFPYNEVMQKLAQSGGALDLAVLKAAAAEDIYAHLNRLAKRKQAFAGQKTREACIAFTEGWFVDVLQGVYGGNARRLMADEKLLRSAFLFYLRNQIPRKPKEAGTNAKDETGDIIDVVETIE